MLPIAKVITSYLKLLPGTGDTVSVGKITDFTLKIYFLLTNYEVNSIGTGLRVCTCLSPAKPLIHMEPRL